MRHQDAPIDGFGAGTAMAVSPDAPDLDIACKLAGDAGRDRMKLSTGKPVLPAAKQVFRRFENGKAIGDVLGRRVRQSDTPDQARERAVERLGALPERILAIERAGNDYPVTLGDALHNHRERVQADVERAAGKC